MLHKEIPIITHITEVKYRIVYIIYSIIVTSVCGYIYKEEIFYILSKPFGKSFIYTNVIEAFVTYIKLGTLTGFYLTYPIVIYQIWSFIVPGLYLYEKKLYRVLFGLSIALFVFAGIFGYILLFPLAYTFFRGFEKIGSDKIFNIELQAKIHEYLLFNTQLILALSFCFQLPILLFLFWILNKELSIWLIHRRRFIYVTSFIFAAIISPPDVLSQLIIAIPLIIFFELSVFTMKLIDIYTVYGDNRN